ncbi:hypothetical protein LCGC14_1476490 [marine sediment metagenome]|uniref:Uncharacterized protein n=1 Tax=marine sediment metagenome TaxID=412755 RepID=A0A0F9JBI9_9ZZZZ
MKYQLTFEECTKVVGHCWEHPVVMKAACLHQDVDHGSQYCVHCGATRQQRWTRAKAPKGRAAQPAEGK